MKLTYRGIQYNSTLTQASTACNNQTATYRGVSYNIVKSDIVAARPAKMMKYRGIVIGTDEVTYQQMSHPAMAQGTAQPLIEELTISPYYCPLFHKVRGYLRDAV